MRVDRYDKTVKIPARVVGGGFEYFYGGPLPELRDGTILDFSVPESAIEDTAFLKVLKTGTYEEILPKGAKVYAAVSSRHIPPALSNKTLSLKNYLLPDELFVEIVLEEPLKLQLRGTKPGRLKAAKCVIPTLNKKALSLNHAYRLISEAFEPDRISHSGNVFQKMMYIVPDKGCRLLDDLRGLFEASHEVGLHLPSFSGAGLPPDQPCMTSADR